MVGKNNGGHGIVSIEDHEKQRRLAPLRQVEAYWRGLCAEGQIPARTQVDPRGMQDALEHAFLIERIAPGMAKLRVSGSHVSDLMGMEMAGMPLSSMILPGERERFSTGVAALFEEPSVVLMALQAERGLGKPELSADLLLLPLRSDFRDVTRGLGVMVSHGRVGRTPRRFAVSDVSVRPVAEVTDQYGAAPTRTTGPEKPPLKGMAEAAKPFQPAPGRGHLRLIVSND